MVHFLYDLPATRERRTTRRWFVQRVCNPAGLGYYYDGDKDYEYDEAEKVGFKS